MTTARRPLRVAYLLRSYPRLSQTFILNEVLALEQLGLPLRIYAMTNPHEPLVQAQVAAVQAPVTYLDEQQARHWVGRLTTHLTLLWRSPWRYSRTLWYVWRHPDCDEGYTTLTRYGCFQQAVALAYQLHRQPADQSVDHLHAHFAHDPTFIAQLVYFLTGLPFSFMAHARDLYQIPPAVLVERIAAAKVVMTCCSANVDYLRQVTPAQWWSKIHVSHPGIDLTLFQPAAHAAPGNAPPLILSVGRLVAKKGFADLIRACALLKQAGFSFRCHIYGEGPLQAELTALIAQQGLAAEVKLAGACTQQELAPILQQATLFALTPYITEDGDRDGAPNVLVEAMSCGLPVVSTTVVGIPELVTHKVDGLLSAPHDLTDIAANLALLLTNEALRDQMGQAARTTVSQRFNLHNAVQRLVMLFTSTADPNLTTLPNHEPFTTAQPIAE